MLFRSVDTVQYQSQHGWLAFHDVFLLFSSIVFVMSFLSLLSLSPFDSVFQPDGNMFGIFRLVGGVELAVFRVLRFTQVLFLALTASTLFCGGWIISGVVGTHVLLDASISVSKALVLLLLIRVLARVVPSFRVDQVTQFSWRVLTPLSLLSLLGSAIFSGLRG